MVRQRADVSDLVSREFQRRQLHQTGQRLGIGDLVSGEFQVLQCGEFGEEAAVASLGRPLAEVAVRFCVSNPHVSVTIPGIRTPAQAAANAAACEPLPAAVVEKLRQLA